MAKCKQATAPVSETPAETPPPPAEAAAPGIAEPVPQSRESASESRRERVEVHHEESKPFVFKTVNAGGTKLHVQHSWKAKEFQIKFGDGGEKDKPSPAVLDYLKSHRKAIVTRDGQEKDVQLFQWNKDDRAWGMSIPYDWKAKDEVNQQIREEARENAKAVFEKVVELVGREHGASPER